MLGERSDQRGLWEADRLYLDHVGKDTFYGLLASLRGQLFRDSDFAGFYCADNGRDSVPPSLLATALLLQSHDKVSDAEAKARADFDIRWKVALGIEIEDRPFAKSTLQVFRAQLILHEKVRTVFESSLRLARESGYLKKRGMRVALDTTNILGRGAVRDTYNLLADGIIKLMRALASVEQTTLRDWAGAQGYKRYLGSSIKGESAIDWSNKKARAGLLATIVADADRLLEVARWAEGIERIHGCIAGRFHRSEPRRRALEYLKGLISPVERKNGWQLAEQAGDATPDGVQRLLYNYRWDANLVRDDLVGYVVEHLGDADAVVVVDETGFLKKGNKSVGVQRQYSGTAGRIENCQVGVFLAYAGAKGRTLLDRELYLPQVWAEDGERRREAGVPEDAVFRTKGQLAQVMLERAVESDVPFGWFTGDEVYGSDRKLRLWLERQGVAHVLAIKTNERLWAWAEKGPLQVRADRLASQVEESEWIRRSAGDGTKGPRIYDWTAVEIRPLREPGKGHWLLARRSIANPGELAYYVCFGPAETALEELVRVAGTRWAIEECFEEAKGQVGLDQYEVRKWDGWYRHITLAMLAHAYLAVVRNRANALCSGKKGESGSGMKP